MDTSELLYKLGSAKIDDLKEQIKDKDEIISLLKEKIERLENENIGLEYKQQIPEFKIKRKK